MSPDCPLVVPGQPLPASRVERVLPSKNGNTQIAPLSVPPKVFGQAPTSGANAEPQIQIVFKYPLHKVLISLYCNIPLMGTNCFERICLWCFVVVLCFTTKQKPRSYFFRLVQWPAFSTWIEIQHVEIAWNSSLHDFQSNLGQFSHLLDLLSKWTKANCKGVFPSSSHSWRSAP